GRCPGTSIDVAGPRRYVTDATNRARQAERSSQCDSPNQLSSRPGRLALSATAIGNVGGDIGPIDIVPSGFDARHAGVEGTECRSSSTSANRVDTRSSTFSARPHDRGTRSNVRYVGNDTFGG